MSAFDAIKQQIDLISVASQYCDLKRIGHGTYQPKENPLRDEKTPSIVFYEESQRWYDYGDNASGDVFDFVSRVENITTIEAREKLSFLIGSIDAPRALHVKSDPIKKSIAPEALEAEFKSFEAMQWGNDAHQKELLCVATEWLYECASKDDAELFHSMTAYDKTNQTLVCKWLNNEGDTVSYKRRRFNGGKWVNRKDTHPNSTAFVRVFDDAMPTYIVEGARDALVGILSGLNIVAIPTTAYSNIDEFRAITEHCKEIVFVCEDAQGYKAMKRLKESIGKGRLMCFGGLHVKCDLADKMEECHSVDEVLGSLIDAPEDDNEGDEVNHSDNDIISKNSTNRLIKASSLTGDITPPQWTIKGVLPEDGLVEFFGASGSYKSFIVLDMCYSIALNREWQGCEVNGGTVVYVAGEGKSGLGRRLKGLELHYQETIDNFYVLPMPTNITDVKEMKLLAEEIAEIGKAKMIIFDTLHRCSAGADENSASDFAVILKNIDTHIKPLCDVVSWVHHTGLDKSRGRGTSARYASLDAQVMIEKIDNLRCVLTCEKQKEAEPFEPMGFEMNSVDIGLMDEELNPIATLVPHLSDVVSADKKEKPLTKLHHEMIASLRLAIQAHGESVSQEIKEREHIREGMMVDVSLWRAEAMKILPSNGDTDAKKVHNAKRMRFQRLKDDLVRAKCAIEFNDKALILGDCELKNV